MFERVQGTFQELLLGSEVDVIEFAKRYNCLHEAQKEMLKYGNYIGTIDEYALELGYACPASNPFRKDFEKLVAMDIAVRVPYDEGYAETHDFSNRSEKITKRTEMFLISTNWINGILKAEGSCFKSRSSSIQRQGNDIRVEANKRRRQRYLRDKKLKEENN